MYSEATVRAIEQYYEQEIERLRTKKTVVARVIQKRADFDNVMQLLAVHETPEGLYIEVA